MSRRTRFLTGLAAFGALLGLVYSTFSTIDFAKHLDRQLHTLNCSFFPGLAEETQLDEAAEGCQVALFSPFSSFARDRYWGGIPVSLLAMGLFGFGLLLAVWALVSRRGHEPVPSLLLLLVGAIAVGASLRFFAIAVSELHTVCRLCAGTYVASAVLLLGALLQAFSARADRRAEAVEAHGSEGRRRRPAVGLLFVLLVELGAAVALPVVAYATAVPDYTERVAGCETLRVREDKAQALVTLPGAGAATDALLVVDPLCAACRAFHRRVEASEAAHGFAYRVLLLPLDAECNWMVGESRHPGACLLSRAILCAGDDAGRVLTFAYDEQERLRDLGAADARDDARAPGKPAPEGAAAAGDGRVRAAVVERFPGLAACIDAPETKIRLNKTLQFAVANRLPLLTPQLYVDGQRLCDEDTDLGLEFALRQLLARGPAPPPPAPPPAGPARLAPGPAQGGAR